MPWPWKFYISRDWASRYAKNPASETDGAFRHVAVHGFEAAHVSHANELEERSMNEGR